MSACQVIEWLAFLFFLSRFSCWRVPFSNFAGANRPLIICIHFHSIFCKPYIGAARPINRVQLSLQSAHSKRQTKTTNKTNKEAKEEREKKKRSNTLWKKDNSPSQHHRQPTTTNPCSPNTSTGRQARAWLDLRCFLVCVCVRVTACECTCTPVS